MKSMMDENDMKGMEQNKKYIQIEVMLYLNFVYPKKGISFIYLGTKRDDTKNIFDYAYYRLIDTLRSGRQY